MLNSPSFLAEKARNIRVGIIKTGYHAGSSHFGGSLSCVELLLAVYLHKKPQDSFILSKGHASLALYVVLESLGVITPEQLNSFNHEGSIFLSHSELHPEFGLNMTNGSLGLGLSFGAGKALAYARNGQSNHVYVLCGNGELNEGSLQEAVMFAGAHKLNGLTLLVDDNQLQLDGPSSKVLPLPAIPDWYKALGWQVTQVDGHDLPALMQALAANESSSGPHLIYARTIKGKGISFMEGEPRFHLTPLSEDEYQQALHELSDEQGSSLASTNLNPQQEQA